MKTSRKIRIAMVVASFPLQEARIDGGTQGVSFYLSQALAGIAEIDLHIIVPTASRDNSNLWNLYGIQVHALEQRNNQRVLSLMNLTEMFKLIDGLSVDIVHFQGLPRWANQCRLPSVVTIHGISERDALFRGSFLISRMKYLLLSYIEGQARRKSKNIIVINPYVYQYLGSLKNKKVWEIPNPVSKGFFTIKNEPIEGRIFSASNMIPRKNVHTLITAFAQLASHDHRAELILAGSYQDSDYGKFCHATVESLGLAKRVKFLGLLSVEQIRRELSKAACFSLCSLQETAPLSISEAMAAGVPVVATPVGGIPWMIEDGKTGILVDPVKIESITQGLKNVLLPDVNHQMRILAKQKAISVYSPIVVAEKTFNVYREILG